MSKFTQGKWEYDDYGGLVWGAGHRMIIAQMRSRSYLFGILGLPSWKIEEIQNANGRLIAAAPEMYELLYDAMQELKGYDPIGNGISTVYPNIEELLARIDGEEANDA